MRIEAFGERAVLVTDVAVLPLLERLRASRPEGVVELVPTEASLLVTHDPARLTSSAVRAWLLGTPPDVTSPPVPGHDRGGHDRGGAGREVRIAVRYDGEDLAEVARLSRLGIEEVVAAHTGRPWRVAFTGFAPGFAYLVDGDPRLNVPRRPSPRAAVPAGAVAVAAGYSGVYPRTSPGGWQVIGHTDAVLWDARRARPALLEPGDVVRFVVAGTSSGAGVASAGAPRATPSPGSLPSGSLSPGSLAPDPSSPERPGPRVRVEACRPGLTVQDGGRPGWAHVGVPPSGAADRAALARANRLLGNPPGAAGLEITLGGCTLRVDADVEVVLAGAVCPLRVGDREAPYETPLVWRAGERLVLGTAPRGLRAYLAVRGGLDVPPDLGSSSTDVLSRLGPDPVGVGRVLRVGRAGADDRPGVDVAPVRQGEGPLRVLPGPRVAGDPVARAALVALLARRWTVSPVSDRVAVRLLPAAPGEQGVPGARDDAEDPLAVLAARSVPSDGLVRGAVQVPPSGELVVFLADHPVTGGYPVPACVDGPGTDRLAQARPGETLTFVEAPGPVTSRVPPVGGDAGARRHP